ncbi:helix-turn-helix domain-containing protein [Leifsonia sp. 21MFCrub1.1]|uniref:helix-turn-helix domain-containing protein n=1 Tax=Leifsonia sp. 21MFCrub1.1 TaxID=1798223 RepID=UPI0008929C04|nr:helix-turn-helix transcriptional regulator [Leifsonia sp. 21MFCrub1.1]SEB09072.1 Helix-turn-helix domain-containing protein [Leifsonia sp. 21MFCrub1.1]
MADFRSEPNVGARIKLARRERGYRTTRDLAEAVPGGNITSAILENIESGRKADISVSQLLNIARALNVPPSYLLAPIGNPNSTLDLPNLSSDFDGMTAAEFDCWLSATPASSYRPRLAAERTDINVLATLRELGSLRRELERLHIVLAVQSSSGDPDVVEGNAEIQRRIDGIEAEARRVAGLLTSGGLTGVVAGIGSES